MLDKPMVSIVIPTKDRCESLKRCLDSLSQQTYEDFEVVIVDGGSTDGTRSIIAEYSEKLPIRFEAQKGGLIPQMNKGWKMANGEVVIRTDDDIVASPQWLRQVVATFATSEEVGGVTGPTIMPEEHKQSRDLFYFQKKLKTGNILWRLIGNIYFNYFLEGEESAVGKWFRSGAFSLGSNYEQCLKLDGCIEVDHHEACNMAVKKELLEQVGGFDETFIGIGEFNEPDVSFKIRKLGYRIMFNPKALVFHLPSKEGFFQERPNSYGRVLNLINFYFRHIKPNNPDKFLRFFSYLLFQNAFFIYKFITTGQIKQLGCILGTIVGLASNIFRRHV